MPRHPDVRALDTRSAGDRLEPWRLFLQAHSALVETLEHELRDELDLALTWYEVLLHLARAPDGRLRMTDLADSLLLSKSGVTRLVDRMEDAGLVERGVCSSDRRGSFAVLTARGRALYRKAAPVHLRGVEEHFLGHLNSTERRALTSGLRKVMAGAGAAAEAS
jgi:DNA-binding MarR family transcriptional regulator